MKMDAPKRRTYVAKPGDIERKWWVVDAEGLILGRLATQIADTLRGKNKASYTPNIDMGDFVIVVNCEKIAMTGKKWTDKIYYHHTNYVGGLKETTAGKVRETHPDRIITAAVRGMLPKNRMQAKYLKKLKVYAGPNHDHAAQNPEPLIVADHAKAA